MDIKIFLDMDGVLCKCHEAALESFGATMEPNKPMNQIVGEQCQFHVDRAYFWATFEAMFWENLEKTDLCDKLIAWSIHYAGLHNVYILSSPTTNPDSAAGKTQWVRTHFPALLPRLRLANDKELLAAPGRILVDDKESNVDKWIDANGTAILVPRPWNGRGSNDQAVIDVLKRIA
jgi:5'(3')-deoxyribonucleotidase